MKRLVERELSPHSVESEAQALLQAMGPHVPPPGMKQRVRARLLATPVASRGFRPRLVVAIALVLVASAAAAATYFVSRGAPARVAGLPVPTAAVAASRAAVAKPAERSAPDAPVEALSARVPVTVTKGLPAPSRTSEKSADEASEANLLFDATRALRRDGNPGRASELLAEYRKKFPRGALAEEALALSIEAAVARGDARAAKLARRYLELYPSGHFVDKAKRALGTTTE